MVIVNGQAFDIDGITEEEARFILKKEEELKARALKYSWNNHTISFDPSEKTVFEELCGNFDEEFDKLCGKLSSFPSEDEAILYLHASINEPISIEELKDLQSRDNFEELLSGAFSMHFNKMGAEAIKKRDDILSSLGYSPEEIEDIRNR